VFYNPVKLIINPGSRANLYNFVQNKRVCLICSQRGHRVIQQDLILSDISPYQTILVDSSADVKQLNSIVVDSEIQMIVAIGGGSVIDSAKIIKHLNNLSVELIALPTTSGTGSEVTPYATGWDYENRKKVGYTDLYPTIAIVDSQLTHNLPLDITVAVGWML